MSIIKNQRVTAALEGAFSSQQTKEKKKKQVEKEGGQHDAISPLQTPKDKSGFSPFHSALVVLNAKTLPHAPISGSRTKMP